MQLFCEINGARSGDLCSVLMPISLLIIISSLLSTINIALTGPGTLHFFLFPILKLEKHLPPPLIWLLSHNSVFSHGNIIPLSCLHILCTHSQALTYNFCGAEVLSFQELPITSCLTMHPFR